MEGRRPLTPRAVVRRLDQVTAEVNIGHNGIVLNHGPNVAVRVGKVRRRRAPRIRRRLLARDVARDRIPRKLPHADALVAPLHRHDAALLLVKRLAEARLVRVLHAAARVVVVVDGARRVELLARHLALAADAAALVRVERHHVALVAGVDGLEDVNLAVLGPVAVVREPEGGPGGAAVRGVLDVEDEKALVVRLFRLDTHREATSRGVWRGAWADGGVDLEDGRVLSRVCEILVDLLV